MISNLMQMQSQISTLDDRVLHQALGNSAAQVPQLMLMMEIANRKNMRSGPAYPPRPMNMMQEMQQGGYQPVPVPPFRWPDMPANPENIKMMGESINPSPQNLEMDPRQSGGAAGLGALFSQNR